MTSGKLLCKKFRKAFLPRAGPTLVRAYCSPLTRLHSESYSLQESGLCERVPRIDREREARHREAVKARDRKEHVSFLTGARENVTLTQDAVSNAEKGGAAADVNTRHPRHLARLTFLGRAA